MTFDPPFGRRLLGLPAVTTVGHAIQMIKGFSATKRIEPHWQRTLQVLQDAARSKEPEDVDLAMEALEKALASDDLFVILFSRPGIENFSAWPPSNQRPGRGSLFRCSLSAP